MKPGVQYVIDGKVMAICSDCGKLVRVDKPFLGSIHYCE